MLQVRENEISLRNSSGGPEYLLTLEGTLLTRQCKWTFTKRFMLSTLQRKSPKLRQWRSQPKNLGGAKRFWGGQNA